MSKKQSLMSHAPCNLDAWFAALNIKHAALMDHFSVYYEGIKNTLRTIAQVVPAVSD